MITFTYLLASSANRIQLGTERVDLNSPTLRKDLGALSVENREYGFPGRPQITQAIVNRAKAAILNYTPGSPLSLETTQVLLITAAALEIGLNPRKKFIENEEVDLVDIAKDSFMSKIYQIIEELKSPPPPPRTTSGHVNSAPALAAGVNTYEHRGVVAPLLASSANRIQLGTEHVDLNSQTLVKDLRSLSVENREYGFPGRPQITQAIVNRAKAAILNYTPGSPLSLETKQDLLITAAALQIGLNSRKKFIENEEVDLGDMTEDSFMVQIYKIFAELKNPPRATSRHVEVTSALAAGGSAYEHNEVIAQDAPTGSKPVSDRLNPVFSIPNGPRINHYVRGFMTADGYYQLLGNHPTKPITKPLAQGMIRKMNELSKQRGIDFENFRIFETAPTITNNGERRPQLHFYQMDSIQAGIRLADERLGGNTNQVGVLDFADANVAGAGPLFYDDARTQEEAIARQTDLFIRLNWIQDRHQNGFFDIPTEGAIVLKNVHIISDGRGNDVPQKSINIIAAALYDYIAWGNVSDGMSNYRHKDMSRGIQRSDDLLGLAFTRDNPLKSQGYMESTRNKIRAIFASAIASGIHNIVIGPIGCGYFGNSGEDVARLMTEVLFREGLATHFDNIVFSDFNGDNIPLFQPAFERGLAELRPIAVPRAAVIEEARTAPAETLPPITHASASTAELRYTGPKIIPLDRQTQIDLNQPLEKEIERLSKIPVVNREREGKIRSGIIDTAAKAITKILETSKPEITEGELKAIIICAVTDKRMSVKEGAFLEENSNVGFFKDPLRFVGYVDSTPTYFVGIEELRRTCVIIAQYFAPPPAPSLMVATPATGERALVPTPAVNSTVQTRDRHSATYSALHPGNAWMYVLAMAHNDVPYVLLQFDPMHATYTLPQAPDKTRFLEGLGYIFSSNGFTNAPQLLSDILLNQPNVVKDATPTNPLYSFNLTKDEGGKIFDEQISPLQEKFAGMSEQIFPPLALIRLSNLTALAGYNPGDAAEGGYNGRKPDGSYFARWRTRDFPIDPSVLEAMRVVSAREVAVTAPPAVRRVTGEDLPFAFTKIPLPNTATPAILAMAPNGRIKLEDNKLIDPKRPGFGFTAKEAGMTGPILQLVPAGAGYKKSQDACMSALTLIFSPQRAAALMRELIEMEEDESPYFESDAAVPAAP